MLKYFGRNDRRRWPRPVRGLIASAFATTMTVLVLTVPCDAHTGIPTPDEAATACSPAPCVTTTAARPSGTR